MSGPDTRSRRARRRRRWAAPLAVVLVAVLATWLVWCHAVVQDPRVDRPAAVDAVLVLGGPAPVARADRAFGLAAAGLTRNLVISTPVGTAPSFVRETCSRRPAGVTVSCFVPDPSTTQGEARHLAQLVAAHGWTRVAVVTSVYHVSRARQIVGRCFGGTLLVITSDEHVGALQWAYQYLYQTAGYLKVWLRSGC